MSKTITESQSASAKQKHPDTVRNLVSESPGVRLVVQDVYGGVVEVIVPLEAVVFHASIPASPLHESPEGVQFVFARSV